MRDSRVEHHESPERNDDHHYRGPPNAEPIERGCRRGHGRGQSEPTSDQDDIVTRLEGKALHSYDEKLANRMSTWHGMVLDSMADCSRLPL
jgi:hypothetical protein